MLNQKSAKQDKYHSFIWPTGHPCFQKKPLNDFFLCQTSAQE